MRPPPSVLAAWGLSGDPVRLPGGMRPTWRVGDTVLKPLDTSPEAAVELGQWLERLPALDRVRLPRPRRAADGRFVVDGWVASEWLAGRSLPAWRAIIEAGEALHEALRHERRPAFLDARTDPWAVADRVAWNEQPLPAGAPPLLGELVSGLPAPDPAGSQLIHGDLSGNVLLEPGLPPAIIDLSLYWRPPRYATAIVVTDARWAGAEEPELVAWARDRTPDFDDALHRALVFRAVSQWLVRPRSLDAAAMRRMEALRP